MNQSQRSYAMGRVSDIEKAKICGVIKKFTTPEKKLKDQDIVDAIKSGKLKIKQNVGDINQYADLCRVFDFKPHTAEEKIDRVKSDPIVKSIRKQADIIRDQIMLGDFKEAMDLIAEFEKFSV